MHGVGRKKNVIIIISIGLFLGLNGLGFPIHRLLLLALEWVGLRPTIMCSQVGSVEP